MHPIEQVGVIPRTFAEEIGILGHGFSRLRTPDTLGAIEGQLVFADRPDAERDPSRKQIIPYGVLCRGDEVFTVERLEGGGESRLHGKISIGIGGHINPVDEIDADGIIHTTLQRELDEELHAHGIREARVVGFINDDTQPVGQVHLGVVYRVELDPGGRAAVREVESLRGGFLAWPKLQPLRRRMETWSSFVYKAHEDGLLA